MDIKLSVVILSMTNNADFFKMTVNCIDSLLSAELEVSKEVIVVESNKNYYNSKWQYPDFVKVIVPDSNFNFHKFLNIGINASSGEFVALCNNDLIFHKDWFSEILKISNNNPEIKSFSPSEFFYDKPLYSNFEIGYKVRSQIKGWCLVAERRIFPQIGYLDELFDFYFADNDYAMTLMVNNVKHAVVYTSYVEHLEKQSSGNILKSNPDKNFMAKYKIPKYLLSENYRYIRENEKSLVGFLKFYSKWGDPKWVYRKNRIAKILLKYHLGYFVKFMYYPEKNINIYKDC